MPEFRSKLEDLMLARELRFPDTAGFKPFRRYFTDESITHPAKANLLLLYYLIKNYTKPGDVILDPMAGTGSTNIIASLLGRHSIYVDIEEKFKKMAEENKRLLEKRGRAKGWIRVLCGDARKLSKLLREVNAILTSPPYERYETYVPSKENIGNLPIGDIDTVITSPPYATTLSNGEGPGATSVKKPSGHRLSSQPKYSNSKENIANLPLGDVDTIITSPPYLKSAEVGAGINRQRPGDVKIGCATVGRAIEHPEAIDNLKAYGKVDTVITSPPYSESLSKRRKGYTTIRQLAGTRQMDETKDENIANLPHGDIDVIITSPSYADARKATKITEKDLERKIRILEEGAKEGRYRSGGKSYRTPRRLRRYSENSDNIDNLPHGSVDMVLTSFRRSNDPRPKGEGQLAQLPHGDIDKLAENLMKNGKPTYLSEMLKVYAEMFKVLKSKGLAIIIIKPFIRNKWVVDLPWHTWLLLQKVGFKLKKLYKLRLKNISFWRILYERKHPEVPKIRHEYIIVVETGTGMRP